MDRFYYSATISDFNLTDELQILGALSRQNEFVLEQTQKDAWREQIRILKNTLPSYQGKIYFEYSIPRMGRRIDVVLLIGAVIFVLEFKVGEKEYLSSNVDQVWDYALDLKNFHETSHKPYIAPVLIATRAKSIEVSLSFSDHTDNLFEPIKCNESGLLDVIQKVLSAAPEIPINILEWEAGQYQPTPTIIEAAMALYNGHNVEEISRSDADEINISVTSELIKRLIEKSKDKGQKSICFVTGVPGAGKTLVGLNIASKPVEDKKQVLNNVFLSGNGPLVMVLREALARDKVRFEKENGRRIKKSVAL